VVVDDEEIALRHLRVEAPLLGGARLQSALTRVIAPGRDRDVSVRFSGASDAEQRSTYLVPLPSGELLPPLFRQGRFIDEADVAATPGVRVVEGAVSFGADLNTYVYPKLVSHRNLFRIPLQ
jgi:hypothetical protein